MRLLSRLIRAPLALIPKSSVVRILTGRLRGMRWLVGSGIHGYWVGTYEKDKQESFIRAAQGAAAFWDIGANVGYYSLLFRALAGPDAPILAVEPDAANVEFLSRHFALNRVPPPDIVHGVVGDENGTVRFNVTGSRFTGHVSDNGELEVQSYSMDRLLSQPGRKPPDLVKMDIEGAELTALRGATECLVRIRPKLFVATHSVELHRQCTELLEKRGYSVTELTGSTPQAPLGELYAVPFGRTSNE